MKVLCECNSFSCRKVVSLSVEEAQRAEGLKRVLIVDGCETGPESTDTFVRKEKGYTIYSEA